MTNWDAPEDYEFVLDSQCGERSDHGRYRIVVEGGEVVDVEAPEHRESEQGPLIDFVSEYRGPAPTLSELAAEAEAAEAEGAEVVELTRDPVDGRPTRLDIDWMEEALDDEACFVVSDYSPTGT